MRVMDDGSTAIAKMREGVEAAGIDARPSSLPGKLTASPVERVEISGSARKLFQASISGQSAEPGSDPRRATGDPGVTVSSFGLYYAKNLDMALSVDLGSKSGNLSLHHGRAEYEDLSLSLSVSEMRFYLTSTSNEDTEVSGDRKVSDRLPPKGSADEPPAPASD